jgi:hypothetical protein
MFQFNCNFQWYHHNYVRIGLTRIFDQPLGLDLECMKERYARFACTLSLRGFVFKEKSFWGITYVLWASCDHCHQNFGISFGPVDVCIWNVYNVCRNIAHTTLYNSGSQTFSVQRPPGSIYTPTAPPYLFKKKHKCAFVSTFILYLKDRLNKIIRVKLNVLCVN